MSCLRTIGRLVSEFARLILFVASVLFLISSLILFAFTYQSKRDFSFAKLDDINNGLTVLVGLSIYLIVLAILGIFSSFYSSKGNIKLLAFMLTLNVIIGVTVLSSTYPKFESAHTELENSFKGSYAKYDWSHQKSNSDIKEATQAWDNIQSETHCCGLQSPTDWAEYRPKELPENMLPISCCQDMESRKGNVTRDYCDTKTEKFWSDGCSMAMEVAGVVILYLLDALVSFSFVLGLLCILVIFCHPVPTHYEGY